MIHCWTLRGSHDVAVTLRNKRGDPEESRAMWPSEKVGEGRSPVGLTTHMPDTILETVIIQSAGRPTSAWRKKNHGDVRRRDPHEVGYPGSQNRKRVPCGAARRIPRPREGSLKDRPGAPPLSPEERGGAITAKRNGWTDGGQPLKKGRSLWPAGLWQLGRLTAYHWPKRSSRAGRTERTWSDYTSLLRAHPQGRLPYRLPKRQTGLETRPSWASKAQSGTTWRESWLPCSRPQGWEECGAGGYAYAMRPSQEADRLPTPKASSSGRGEQYRASHIPIRVRTTSRWSVHSVWTRRLARDRASARMFLFSGMWGRISSVLRRAQGWNRSHVNWHKVSECIPPVSEYTRWPSSCRRTG
jgi:hypothetical protein